MKSRCLLLDNLPIAKSISKLFWRYCRGLYLLISCKKNQNYIENIEVGINVFETNGLVYSFFPITSGKWLNYYQELMCIAVACFKVTSKYNTFYNINIYATTRN